MNFLIGTVLVLVLLAKCSPTPTASEEQAKKDREWQEKQTRIYEMQKSATEERERALTEWDTVSRSNIDERRKKLEKASRKVMTDSSGSTRVDTYYLKKGGTVNCSTKVTDSGTFMNCDGEP